MRQQQFLDVIDRAEAERRFRAALPARVAAIEEVVLAAAHGRVLACDVAAPVDVPCFDRSNVDGFAVQAEDTYGASENEPALLRMTDETLATAIVPAREVTQGHTTPIATGAMLPRGADAVVMIEDTHADEKGVWVARPAEPGANVTFAGTDIARGETVLRRGQLLSARETGVLAAIGVDRVRVTPRPKVAIISTGDEIIPPGTAMRPGFVYDSNATVLADTVREMGGEPVLLGIVPDETDRLRAVLRDALGNDMVLLSGGTSKGTGDVSYRVVGELGSPGIVVHGVALKPGKPLCLAVVDGVPIAVLPGFPTSAIFTFREFLGPLLRELAGLPADDPKRITARLPMRIRSARGRTEYTLVGLTPAKQGWSAYPIGKGSGSVTTFGHADGYVTIARNREYLEEGEEVEVRLIAPEVRFADLVVIGSHCLGLDVLLGRVSERGYTSKFLAVGSMGGVSAIRRGECDVAGIHLFDEATGVYNEPFRPANAALCPGYRRRQGIVFRRGDRRFEGKEPEQAVAAALADPDCRMVHRNRGSGTRVLIDRLLGTARPAGYAVEARSHHAVAAAVSQMRADWGMAIRIVADQSSLGFLPYRDERYDFLTPIDRADRPAVRAFFEALAEPECALRLRTLGFDRSEHSA